MLDDECKLGTRGADKNYAAHLERALGGSAKGKGSGGGGGHARFSVSSAQRARGQFAVAHYAGPVVCVDLARRASVWFPFLLAFLTDATPQACVVA